MQNADTIDNIVAAQRRRKKRKKTHAKTAMEAKETKKKIVDRMRRPEPSDV